MQTNVVAEELHAADAYAPLGEFQQVYFRAGTCCSEEGVSLLVQKEYVIEHYAVEEPQSCIAYLDMRAQLFREHIRGLPG